MKYKVSGADMYSGEDVELVIDAASRDAAAKKAARQSVVIVTVDPADEELRPGARKFSISDESGASVSPTVWQTWKPTKKEWFNIAFPWKKIARWLWRMIPRIILFSSLVLYRWVWWKDRPSEM